MYSDSFPAELWKWTTDGNDIDAGVIKPKTSMNLSQVVLAVCVDGVVNNKKFTLTLTDSNNGARVFSSSTKQWTLSSGSYLGYFVFNFSDIFVKSTDEYNVNLSVDDSTGFTFGVIGDWTPTINTHTQTERPEGPRVELYGVESGLYAC